MLAAVFLFIGAGTVLGGPVYIKIDFYETNGEFQKGACLGCVVLKGETYNVDIADKNLKKILETDYFVPMSPSTEMEEVKLPDGRKIMKNGMLLYQAGTVDYLKVTILKVKKLGYIVEVEEGAQYLT